MRGKIRWAVPIAMGIIFIIVIIVLHTSVDRMYEDIDLKQLPEKNLNAKIIVTLSDKRYHRPDCPRIRGETRDMTYGAAKNRLLEPCPYCFPQDAERNADGR